MITAYCEKLGFPAEAAEALTTAWQQLQTVPEADALLTLAEQRLYDSDHPGYEAALQALYAKTEVHPYTVDLLFYLRALIPLKEIYAKKGLPEDLYWNAAKDLRWKLMECHTVYGIWGTFTHWFDWFYLCKRFALGRLQFEVIEFPAEDVPGVITKGEPVLNCHIPSSGPLTKEAVIASLRQAWEFFPQLHKDGILTVHCSSWLLYQPFRETYPQGSNLRQFFDLFRIVESWPRSNAIDFNRVFGMNWTPDLDPDTVPQHTKLQKNIIAHLKQGGSFGAGRGLLRFDGENVITD